MIKMRLQGSRNEIRWFLKVPKSRLLDISEMTESQMDKELEKGYDDMKAGRIKSAKTTFADIRKDYDL